MKRILVAVTAMAVVAGTATAGSAYSGVLDSTFSGDGVVALGRADNALLAARSDGVVISLTQRFSRADGTVVTLRATDGDGAPDMSFSGDGVATPNLGNSNEVNAIAVDAQNRILLLAYARSPQIIRLTADGRVDTSFGVSGKRVLPWAETYPGALTIDSAGRIVVVLTKTAEGRGFRTDAVVARVLPGGRLDKAFGTDGRRTLDLSRSDFFITVDTDALDRPVIASGAFLRSGPVRVARLTEAKGRLDSSFGGDGVASVKFPDGLEPVVTALSAETSVTVGGVVFGGEGLPAFALRLTDAGAADPSFGGDGSVTFLTGAKQAMAATAVDEFGAVLAAGYSSTGRRTSAPLVAGVLPDGSTDTGFGPNGRAVLPVGQGRAEAGPGVIVDGQFVVLVRSQVDGAKGTRSSYQLVRLVTPPT